MMVDQQAACNVTPIVCSQISGCHTKLIRDEEGRLEEVSVPCDKMEQIREIQFNYVYHDFPKE
ncbi:hypothetical protein FACS1894218_0310 [Bacilli bacterium]|nr:hypothetical protein FACS1894218_0310 [Bacilli bacterium]